MEETIVKNIGLLISPEKDGELLEIQGASIRIIDGIIKEVSEGNLSPSTQETMIIDAEGMMALPGIVDPHTHSVFAGDRSEELIMKLKGYTYLQILKNGGGIEKTLKETRRVDIKELKILLKKRMEEFGQRGITTIEIKSGYGMDKETEIKQLRAALEVDTPLKVVTTFLGAHIIPPEYRERREEYIQFLIYEMIPLVARRKLAKFVDVFCDEGFYTLKEAKEILSAGKRNGLGLKIHSDELKNLGCTRMAAELGAISADHLLLTEDDDLQAMADSGTIPVLLPGTVFTTFLPSYPNARKMLDMGLPVALATDFNPNCPLQDPFFLANLATYKMKMLPEEILRALTINAAKALGKENEIGSFSSGKRGDLLLLRAKNLTELFYRIGYNPVYMSVKEGKVKWKRNL